MTSITETTEAAAHIAATTGATRLWLGLDAAGHVAQYWTRQPVAHAHAALRLVELAITPAGAQPVAVFDGWEDYGDRTRPTITVLNPDALRAGVRLYAAPVAGAAPAETLPELRDLFRTAAVERAPVTLSASAAEELYHAMTTPPAAPAAPSDLTTVPCPCCKPGDGCDECHGQGRIIVSRTDMAAAGQAHVLDERDQADSEGGHHD
jgi:hypothetical protein